MTLIISFFLLGIGIGLALKKINFKPVKTVERFTNWSIYALLMILGISVGLNSTIIKNLPTIGLKALIISVFGIVFSLIAAAAIYYSFFHRHEK